MYNEIRKSGTDYISPMNSAIKIAKIKMLAKSSKLKTAKLT